MRSSNYFVHFQHTRCERDTSPQRVSGLLESAVRPVSAICARRVGRRLGKYPRLRLNVGTTVRVVDDEPNLVDLVKGYLERERRAHSFAAPTSRARPVFGSEALAMLALWRLNRALRRTDKG